MEATMNSPNNRNRQDYDPAAEHASQYSPHYQPEEPAEAAPRFTPDAPPLRSGEYEYDPVWVEQSAAEQREALTQDDLDRIEQIITSENFNVRRPRKDFMPPPPPPAERARGGLGWTVGTFVLLVGASAFIAYQMTDRSPLEGASTDSGAPLTRLASLVNPPAMPAGGAKTAFVRPSLVVNGASADSPDQILLGVSVEGTTDGVNAVVGGLAPGTKLSTGRQWGATGWIVPATELANTYLRPPLGFAGTMEYTVALQLPDKSEIDRQSMRLEWAAPATQSPTAQTPAQAPAQTPPAQQQTPPAPQQATVEQRRLDPNEVNFLVKRGEELLTTGDIASARLLLRRAAEAHDARAALALAASYDPIELKRLGVYGSTPDVVAARDWYEKAKQFGSREAPRRLELLASQYR
jgi:hypothetical protein